MTEQDKSETGDEITLASERFEKAVGAFRKANNTRTEGKFSQEVIDLILLKAKRMTFESLKQRYGLSDKELEKLGSPSKEEVEKEWRECFVFENSGLENAMTDVALSIEFMAVGIPDIPIWEMKNWSRI